MPASTSEKQRSALRFATVAAAATLAAAALGAHAATVTLGFEGRVADDDSVPVDQDQPYVESGYQLTYTGNPGTVEIYGKDFSAAAYNTHGSAVLGFCPPASFFCRGDANVLTLTHNTPFSLASLAVANLYTDGTRADGSTPNLAGELLMLVGLRGDGSTVLASLDVGTGWGPVGLNGFFNLVSVTFTPSANSSAFFAIDDLVLDAPDAPGGAVPEPMTLALAGVALAALAATRRRCQSAAKQYR